MLEGRLRHRQSQFESPESRRPTGYGPTGYGSLSRLPELSSRFFQFSTALLCQDRRAEGRILYAPGRGLFLKKRRLVPFVCVCIYVCLVSLCVQPCIPGLSPVPPEEKRSNSSASYLLQLCWTQN